MPSAALSMLIELQMAKNKVLICPYCGDTQPASEHCRSCGGLFEPLSRQATQNAMGPWFIRDERRPFQPGCSFDTLVKMIQRGQVTKYSIVRGPTTKQFWTVAKHIPGIAHLLGYCHNCDATVKADDYGCHACGVPFEPANGPHHDRNFLGLPEVRPMPWEQSAALESDRTVSSSNRAGVGAFEHRRETPPWPRPGRGISSFASDEELRGGIDMRPQPAPFVSAGAQHLSDSNGEDSRFVSQPFVGGGSLPTPNPMPVPAALGPAHHDVAAFDSGAEHPAASPIAGEELGPPPASRALRRRIDQLRRTVRTLAILLLIMSIVTVVLAAMILARRIRAAEREPGAAQAVEQIESAGAQDAQAKSPLSEAPFEAPSSPAQENGQARLRDHNQSSPVVADATSRKAAIENQYVRAEQLIAQAQDTARPLPDRIRDYEEAINILKDIDANAPAEFKPPGLPERLTESQRQLERLRLKEFFP
jgi:hypothetical protein